MKQIALTSLRPGFIKNSPTTGPTADGILGFDAIWRSASFEILRQNLTKSLTSTEISDLDRSEGLRSRDVVSSSLHRTCSEHHSYTTNTVGMLPVLSESVMRAIMAKFKKVAIP
jgi:hypothetical protein